jgi:hypothetical protein
MLETGQILIAAALPLALSALQGQFSIPYSSTLDTVAFT